MTSSTDLDSDPGHELLKLDSRGRVQISPERREALLEEFDRSGMTGAGFARHYGIKYTTFAHWIRMRKRARGHVEQSSSRDKFMLVSQEGAACTSTSGLTIDLPHGAKVTISTPAQAELAGALIRSIGTGN